jgi:hypothetical protein
MWDFGHFICQLITHLDDTPHHSTTAAASSTPTAPTPAPATTLENDTRDCKGATLHTKQA